MGISHSWLGSQSAQIIVSYFPSANYSFLGVFCFILAVVANITSIKTVKISFTAFPVFTVLNILPQQWWIGTWTNVIVGSFVLPPFHVLFQVQILYNCATFTFLWKQVFYSNFRGRRQQKSCCQNLFFSLFLRCQQIKSFALYRRIYFVPVVLFFVCCFFISLWGTCGNMLVPGLHFTDGGDNLITLMMTW